MKGQMEKMLLVIGVLLVFIMFVYVIYDRVYAAPVTAAKADSVVRTIASTATALSTVSAGARAIATDPSVTFAYEQSGSKKSVTASFVENGVNKKITVPVAVDVEPFSVRGAGSICVMKGYGSSAIRIFDVASKSCVL